MIFYISVLFTHSADLSPTVLSVHFCHSTLNQSVMNGWSCGSHPTPNLYVEALTPNVTAFRDRRQLHLDEIVRVGTSGACLSLSAM